MKNGIVSSVAIAMTVNLAMSSAVMAEPDNYEFRWRLPFTFTLKSAGGSGDSGGLSGTYPPGVAGDSTPWITFMEERGLPIDAAWETLQLIKDGGATLVSAGSLPDEPYPNTAPTGVIYVVNTDLVNINSLSNITSAGDSANVFGSGMLIKDNANLKDINGLLGLKEIPAVFQIENNVLLDNLNGLQNVQSIGGYFVLNNPINDISGLQSVNSLSGTAIISGTNLENMNGLNTLMDLSGSLSISQNFNMEGLDGLVGLTSVDGSITISNNPQLRGLNGLSNLSVINGSLDMSDNALQSLSGLSRLSFVGGNLDLSNNELVNIAGLSNLDTVSGNLYLSGNQIDHLEGLANLTSVGGALSLGTNPLTNIDGLSKLNNVGGTLSITQGHMLNDLNGFVGLTSIGGNLQIYYSSTLMDISGLANINSIPDNGIRISIGSSQYDDPSFVGIPSSAWLCQPSQASKFISTGISQANACQ